MAHFHVCIDLVFNGPDGPYYKQRYAYFRYFLPIEILSNMHIL